MIKVKLRRFVARYLGFIIEWIYKIKFYFIRIKNPPVIILTPGKVGSASVYYTLKKELNNPIFHIHQYSDVGIEKSIQEHLSSNRKSKPLHLIVAKLLKSKMKAYKGDVYIITIIREPISREVSGFFQNTEFFKSEIEDENLVIDENKAQKLLSKIFETDIIQKLEDWFEREINENFGIDLFSKEFPEKGYLISNNGSYKHLFMKMEFLDSVFSKAIQEFFQIENSNLSLSNENIAEDKFYAESYQSIKKKLKLTELQVMEVVSSNFFQKYYKNETEKVINRWMKD